MSVYLLFQRQGFTPLHPALLTWCKSISVCGAAAAAGDELWECSGGMQELWLWCPSGSLCSPDIQNPVPCQLGWPCKTAMLGVRSTMSPAPRRAGARHRSEGMDAARAMPLVPVLPTSSSAHLGPAQQIQSGCGWISAIVCAHWSMAEKMKLCLQDRKSVV